MTLLLSNLNFFLFLMFVVASTLQLSVSEFFSIVFMEEENLVDPTVDVYLSQLNECDILNDRFNHKTDEQELQQLMQNAKPKNTSKQEAWAIKIWNDWATLKNHQASLAPNENHPVPEVSCFINFTKMEYWLPYFIMEVRNKEGHNYSPNTVKQIIASIYRYLRDNCCYEGPSFLDKKSKLYKVLESRMKELKKQGHGLAVKRADIVSTEDEEVFWSSGVFDLETSEGLLKAVFFYTGKAFALRGREEHRKLRIEQFKLKTNSAGVDYIEFWPILRKNEQGNVVFDQMRKDAIKHFDDPCNEKSYVKIMKKYLSNLPESEGPFYRRAIKSANKIAFSRAPVGVNTLCDMLKSIYIEAGIDISNRNISNHGLRATNATKLLNSGFDISTIRKRTGHKSNAIEAYLRNDEASDQSTSKCLDPPMKRSSSEAFSESNAAVSGESKDVAADVKESVALKQVSEQKKMKTDDCKMTVEVKCGDKIVTISLSN